MRILQSIPFALRRAREYQYLQFLTDRDGIPDVENRKLPGREAYFAEKEREQVRWEGVVPVNQFGLACRAKSPKELKGFSILALWMAAMACVNRAEGYVIKLALERKVHTDPNDPMTTIQLEEDDHTHMLLKSIGVLGIRNVTIDEPRGVLRWFLYLAAYLPQFFSDILAIIGEAVGIVLFMALREKAQELFADGSPAAERIILYPTEILVDEIGHLEYVKGKLGQIRMFIARSLIRVIAPQLIRSYPVFVALFGEKELVQRVLNLKWTDIPSEIRARAFCPDAQS